MKAVLLALVVVCLTGCGGNSAPAQYSPDAFSVSMHWYEDAAALRTSSILHRVAPEAEAFSIMTYRGADYRCEIHIVRPTDLSPYTQELIGHEFAHCIYGAWHK